MRRVLLIALVVVSLAKCAANLAYLNIFGLEGLRCRGSLVPILMRNHCRAHGGGNASSVMALMPGALTPSMPAS